MTVRRPIESLRHGPLQRAVPVYKVTELLNRLKRTEGKGDVAVDTPYNRPVNR